MGKPTLQEIAAMPFPASLLEVRRYYDPCWNVNPDGAEFRVTLDFEVREDRSVTYTIDARSADEAEATAREMLADEVGGEIHDLSAFVRAANCPDDAPLLAGLVH